MGEQLSLIEDFYKEDKEKRKVLRSLVKISRDLKYLYGHLASYERGFNMFSTKGRMANVCMDEAEHVSTALAMVIYDELSELPEQKGKSFKEISEEICKLEVMGIGPVSTSKDKILEIVYEIPDKVTAVSEDIESSRKGLLLSTLLKLITEIEEL